MAPAAESLTKSDLDTMSKELSNWGRWGDDDERGALNLITDAGRAAAAALVSDGVTVSCALPLPTTPGPGNPTPVLHHMIRGGDAPRSSSGIDSSSDFFAIEPHGLATTHLDALCHVFVDGKMYNGFDQREVRSDGAHRNSIMAGEDGVCGRGVLLDIPALYGVERLEPGAHISVGDLEAAEERQGVQVSEGDLLLVATGRDAHHERQGTGGGSAFGGLAGLDAACIPWLHQRGVAVLGSDGISDAIPSAVEGWILPVHQIAIVSMGVHLIDNMQLARLATACAERGRWEFLLTLAPLLLERGTASPVNPIAMF